VTQVQFEDVALGSQKGAAGNSQGDERDFTRSGIREDRASEQDTGQQPGQSNLHLIEEEKEGTLGRKEKKGRKRKSGTSLMRNPGTTQCLK